MRNIDDDNRTLDHSLGVRMASLLQDDDTAESTHAQAACSSKFHKKISLSSSAGSRLTGLKYALVRAASASRNFFSSESLVMVVWASWISCASDRSLSRICSSRAWVASRVAWRCVWALCRVSWVGGSGKVSGNMFGAKRTQASYVEQHIQTPRDISAKHTIHKKEQENISNSSTFCSLPQSPLRSCMQ